MARRTEHGKGSTVNKKLLEALDALGVALAGQDHVWTNEERRLYEEAASLLSTAG